jgi:hypothetical protein
MLLYVQTKQTLFYINQINPKMLLKYYSIRQYCSLCFDSGDKVGTISERT